MTTNSTAFDVSAATAAAGVPQIEQPTRLSADLIAATAADLRSTVDGISARIELVHVDSIRMQLTARADEVGKRPPSELLDEVADAGFSWVSVARILGVSVPALRKWRNGESVAPENRRKLANLVAFVGVVKQSHRVADVASWVEMPIAGSDINGIDVLSAGHLVDLVQFALDNVTGSNLLSATFPGWESRQDDKFEVVADSDGVPFIRMRREDAER